MIAKKIIVVTAERCNCYEQDYCGCEPTLEFKECHTIGEILGYFNIFEREQEGVVCVSKDNKLTTDQIKLLKAHGFSRIDLALKRAEKDALQKKHYLVDKSNGAYSYHRNFEEVDLDSLDGMAIERLAKGEAEIVQGVSVKGALTDGDYKKYLTARRRHKEQEEKRKAAKKARLEKKQQKEIEKAKALLESVGEAKGQKNGK